MLIDPFKVPLGQIEHRLPGELQHAAIVYNVTARTQALRLFVPVRTGEGIVARLDRALDAFVMHEIRCRDARLQPGILDHDLDEHAVLPGELVDLFQRHLFIG